MGFFISLRMAKTEINGSAVSGIMTEHWDLVNPWKDEIWDVKDSSGRVVYHKDKTVENCFLKYGIGRVAGESTERTYKRLIFDNSGREGLMHVPRISDFISKLETGDYMPSFLTDGDYIIDEQSGFDLQTDIMLFYSSNPIRKPIFNFLHGDRSERKGDINFASTWNLTFEEAGHFLELRNLMYRVKGVNVWLNLCDRTSIGSLDFAFANSEVQSIQISEKTYGNLDVGAVPRSVNGMFEFAKVTGDQIPQLRWYRCFEFCYMFDVCNSIDYIPAATTDFTEDRYNVWIANQGYPAAQGSFTQLFCICPNLTKVGPVIDVSQCHTRDKVYRMFGCKNLTQLRLKGINHFDWDFTAPEPEDSARQCLPNLDEASVKYLVDNAVDLKAQWRSTNEGDWNHTVQEAKLNIPASWNQFITMEQGKVLTKKGWRLFVDGTERIFATSDEL